ATSPLSLHDALPIYLEEPAGLRREPRAAPAGAAASGREYLRAEHPLHLADAVEAGAVAPAHRLPRRSDRPGAVDRAGTIRAAGRSEEHTSELQSRGH